MPAITRRLRRVVRLSRCWGIRCVLWPFPRGGELTYRFEVTQEGPATLFTAMIPTQPYDQGDLRYTVQVDDAAPVIISLREPFRSESWKQSVLRGQALKAVPVTLSKGGHTLRLKALDGHIIADQWMIR